jgi:hypothetical protein
VKTRIQKDGGSKAAWGGFLRPLFTISYKNDGRSENGTIDAYHNTVQQLGNGAIVEMLGSGRSFFDGRARGEGSKGYVVKRDAHNREFDSGQHDYNDASLGRPRMPRSWASNQAGRCHHFRDEFFSSYPTWKSRQVILSTHS